MAMLPVVNKNKKAGIKLQSSQTSKAGVESCLQYRMAVFTTFNTSTVQSWANTLLKTK